ncbi:hypothetical protein [Halobacteriovorax sp. HLS]|uniref:hypothetical protein n=1 Tax=Halobacteriovorax sp. HLS TaxID=2234000 RepID=UPI000FD840BF|nr:hypothetical protein [Halobacteriovorax sp. HLS]
MQKTLILFFLTFLSFTGPVFAAKYYRLTYITRTGDSFAGIFKRFVRPGSIVHAQTQMTQKTKNANPHVDNWAKLEPGTSLTLYISADLMDLKRYKKYEKKVKKKLSKIKDVKKETLSKSKSGASGLKLSAFYMGSLGKFSQVNNIGTTINFFQNSPVSVGIASSYYPDGKLYSYAGSIYYSTLKAAVSNVGSGEIAVPAEVGANLYYEYRLKRYNLTVYGGVDYETFSTFNMGAVNNSAKLLVDENSIIYATVGVSKLLKVRSYKLFTKFSISKSISSSQTIAAGGVDTGTSYDGLKYMVYLNYKISKKFYLHSLFKMHTMSGPDELTTTRIGLGFGYIFN